MPKQRPGKSKQDYATPPEFIVAVKARLGITEFVIDLAADVTNHQAAFWLDEEDDSLAQNWHELIDEDGWAWLNPPFSKIGPWAEKCKNAMQAGKRIAFLVPASVGSNWYRDHIHDTAGVKTLFLNGRLDFIPGELYPKDCMLILFDYYAHIGYTADIWTWRPNGKKRKTSRRVRTVSQGKRGNKA